MTTTPERPLRRDAERNRLRILDAARELFTQRGLGVTLNDIARHAGVGVGTVYRRFPDKSVLLDGLFEQKVEEIVGLMEQALSDPDPWHGLCSFLERALALQARDLALRDLVRSSPAGLERVGTIRARLMPLGFELFRRAKESGQLRPDVEAQDIGIIQLMLSFVIDGARDIDPDLWRRYLEIVLQGLRADPQPPAPLAHPPLAPEQVDAVMAAARLPRR